MAKAIRGEGMQIMQLQRERGAATVEFSICAIILFLFVFGIIELGILMYDKHILTNASREATRAGIVMTKGMRLPNDEIQDIAREYARDFMVSFRESDLDFGPWVGEDPENWIVPNNVSDRTGNLFGTTPLIVTIKYEFNFLLLSGFGLGPITLTAQTEMIME